MTQHTPVRNRSLGQLHRWQHPGVLCACLWVSLVGAAQGLAQQPLPNNGQRPPLADAILFDREWQLRLSSASKRLAEKQVDAGLELLQRTFLAPQDRWITPNPQAPPQSGRGTALELLRQAGPEVWKRYEALYGPDATRDYKTLGSLGKPKGWLRVMQQYPASKAAFQAGDDLAVWLLDHGQAESAVAIWKGLAANPWSAQFLRPEVLARWHLAATRAGLPVPNLVPANTQVQVGGQVVPLERLTLAAVARIDSIPARIWPTYLGNAARSQAAVGTLPTLRPERVISQGQLATPTGAPAQYEIPLPLALRLAEVQAELGIQLSDTIMGEAPGATAVQGTKSTGAWGIQPIVVGGQVIFRDWSGIRSLDPATGQTVWHHPTQTSLVTLAPRIDEQSLDSEASLRNNLNKAYRTNSVLGWLSTDGARVFYLDEVEVFPQPGREEPPRPARAFPPDDPVARTAATPWNRLLALEARPATGQAPRVLWSVGGPRPEKSPQPLDGHFFLGAPLPCHQLLYVLTEAEQMVWLTCLTPHGGEVLWQQPLAVAVRGRPAPDARVRTACQPTAGGSVLYCPTNSGLLIAVEALTGQLRWIADVREETQRWPVRSYNVGQGPQEHLELPLTPQVMGGKVVTLDPLTGKIYCHSATTGTTHWNIDLPGAKFLGVLTPELALVVTGVGCQALSLSNGTVLWTTELGPPAGTGFRLGEGYLLPLVDGRSVWLDLQSGTQRGYGFRHVGSALGNLIPAGNMIVSVTPAEVALFPQSQALLDRPVPMEPSAPEVLQRAETLLRLGNIDAARATLSPLLQEPLSATELTAARRLFRETIWAELEQRPELITASLERWLSLAETDSERAQIWFVASEVAARQRDWKQSWKAARELALFVGPNDLLEFPDQAYRRVTGATWLAALQSQIHTAQPATLASALPRIPENLDYEDRPILQRELSLQPPQSPAAATLLNALAGLELSVSNAQRAEILWLQARTQGGPAAAEATRQLVELYERQGLYSPGSRYLQELRTTFADVALPTGQTGRDYVAGLPETHLSKQAAQRFVPPDWPIRRVRILEERDEHLPSPAQELDGFRRTIFPTWMPLGVSILNRGFNDDSRLTLVDRETGTRLTDLKLPPRSSVPNYLAREPVGHLVPMTSSEGVLGISLLERNFIWRQPLDTAQGNLQIRVGLATPRQIIAQTSSKLVALDPLTGNVLWERNHLDPEEGLFKDPLLGMFGDDEVLVVIRANRKSYRVFRTTDGSLIREGEFKHTIQDRMNFGRILAYRVHERSGEAHFCLWDPLTDQFLMRRTIGEAILLQGSLATGEITLANPAESVVEVLNGFTGQTKLRIQLPEDALHLVQSVRLFQDATRYYLHIQRQMPGTTTRAPFGDSVWLPLTQLYLPGDLIAVDRATATTLWQRTCLPMSWLDVGEYQLPLIITLAQLQRTGLYSRRVLALEVLDAATGETLATHQQTRTDGQVDRLHLVDYQRDAGQIQLIGPHVRYTLDFSRKTQQQQFFDERSVPEVGSSSEGTIVGPLLP